jgi:hypothetical protein
VGGVGWRHLLRGGSDGESIAGGRVGGDDGASNGGAAQDRDAEMADLQAEIGLLEACLLERTRRVVVLRQGAPPGLSVPSLGEAMVPGRLA